MSKPTSTPQSSYQNNSFLIILGFIIGVLMLGVLFFAPSLIDCPPSNGVAKVILGLAAGGFASGLTGALLTKKAGITAMGGMAVFVIIFFAVDSKSLFKEESFPDCETCLEIFESNNLNRIEMSIESGKCDVNGILYNNEAPIHIAIRKAMNSSNTRVIQYLIDKGAEIDLNARVALVQRCRSVGLAADGLAKKGCCDHVNSGEISGCN